MIYKLLTLLPFIYCSIASNAIFPANKDVYLDWNIGIEILDERGRDLFNQLFNDFNNLEIEILASYSMWTESPLYIHNLNSILFSSPSDRNIYSYNLDTKETILFIQNDDDIPLDECLECGPNGMTTNLNGFADYVIINQLALKRVIAFDPLDIDENNIIVIADNLNGIELNSPNDITTTINGKSIYFSDPTFGLQREGDTGFMNSFYRSKLDIMNGDSEPILVIDDMDGPNGLAVTNDGKYLIVSNTGNKYGWSPFWNVYQIPNNNKNKYDKRRYKLIKRIPFNMDILSWNSFYKDSIPLLDGICLIDLKHFKIIGRITIDHLISNIYIDKKWIYLTGKDNLWRIKLTN